MSETIVQKPRLGCAGIVTRGQAVLLGKRNKDPNRGLWVLPGGGVNFGETFKAALCREIREETGLTELVIGGVAFVRELINLPDEHRVIVFVRAACHDGTPKASSDLSEAGFFEKEDLLRMSKAKEISPFVETVLRDAGLL